MDLTALKSLDVDDIEVVEADALAGVSASPGIIINAAGPVAQDTPRCGPVHTHAVGDLPVGPPDLALDAG
jgi:hypothetical protein